MPTADSDIASVFAAGSLRAALTAVGKDLEERRGHAATITFGPSGLLRDRIAAGERVDVFASANMEHPQSLTNQGWSGETTVFARNELCVITSPRVPITPANVLDVLLDPQWKLGTSTPKADPSGDYAWEAFRRAETVRPGAFAALDSRARMLTGGPQSPPTLSNRSLYAMLVSNGDADCFLTYCTNGRQAVKEVPTLTCTKLPENIAVAATYGLAVCRNASGSGRAFAEYMLSPGGQRTLARFGFAPP